MKTCQDIRDRLLRRPPAAASGPQGDAARATIADHLAGCPGCRGFAARLDAVRGGLRAHHAGVEPDLAFASRVRARLSGDASAALGLAALRLLPVTAAVLLVLLGFSLAGILSGSGATGEAGADGGTGTAVATAGPAGDEAAPTEEWVAWVLRPEEEATP